MVPRLKRRTNARNLLIRQHLPVWPPKNSRSSNDLPLPQKSRNYKLSDNKTDANNPSPKGVTSASRVWKPISQKARRISISRVWKVPSRSCKQPCRLSLTQSSRISKVSHLSTLTDTADQVPIFRTSWHLIRVRAKAPFRCLLSYKTLRRLRISQVNWVKRILIPAQILKYRTHLRELLRNSVRKWIWLKSSLIPSLRHLLRSSKAIHNWVWGSPFPR